MPDDDEVLRIADVCALFGVHKTTLARWVRDDKIPYFKTPGGHVRFRKHQIELWMRRL